MPLSLTRWRSASEALAGTSKLKSRSRSGVSAVRSMSSHSGGSPATSWSSRSRPWCPISRRRCLRSIERRAWHRRSGLGADGTLDGSAGCSLSSAGRLRATACAGSGTRSTWHSLIEEPWSDAGCDRRQPRCPGCCLCGAQLVIALRTRSPAASEFTTRNAHEAQAAVASRARQDPRAARRARSATPVCDPRRRTNRRRMVCGRPQGLVDPPRGLGYAPAALPPVGGERSRAGGSERVAGTRDPSQRR